MNARQRAKSAADVARFSVYQAKQREAKKIFRRTCNFTANELDSLVHVYNELAASEWSNGTLNMSNGCLGTVLYMVFDMPERQAVVDRITSALSTGETSSFYITLTDWMQMMSLFLHGTAAEQMRFCYRCYDRLQTDALEPDSIMRLLRGDALAARADVDMDELELELQSYVDTLMVKMDHDRDGMVSWLDYRTVVREQPLMMECFGRCIPDRQAVYAFLVTFSAQTWKF